MPVFSVLIVQKGTKVKDGVSIPTEKVLLDKSDVVASNANAALLVAGQNIAKEDAESLGTATVVVQARTT